MADDFSINESGEIIRENVQEVPQTEEEKLMAEYSQLEYEIHHLTRPTKSPEKIARYEELKKILGIDEEAKKNALIAGKEKVLAKIKEKGKQDNSLLKAMMEKRRQELKGE